MKIMNGYMLKNFRGESIAVPNGLYNMSMKRLIRLNPTAAYLWKRMESDCTRQELISGLVNEFDVDEERAAKDIDLFVNSLRDNNMLE